MGKRVVTGQYTLAHKKNFFTAAEIAGEKLQLHPLMINPQKREQLEQKPHPAPLSFYSEGKSRLYWLEPTASDLAMIARGGGGG